MPHIPIDQLTSAPYNPRAIAPAQLDTLKRSLTADPQFFESRPCLVNQRPDGTLIVYAGNMRLRAARELGWTEVPCVDVHPTQKPMALWMLLLKNHSKPLDVLYDPFLGSGTTIIASEQLHRVCYGMEISPLFCDVIRNRYAQFVGDPKWAANPEKVEQELMKA